MLLYEGGSYNLILLRRVAQGDNFWCSWFYTHHHCYHLVPKIKHHVYMSWVWEAYRLQILFTSFWIPYVLYTLSSILHYFGVNQLLIFISSMTNDKWLMSNVTCPISNSYSNVLCLKHSILLKTPQLELDSEAAPSCFYNLYWI